MFQKTQKSKPLFLAHCPHACHTELWGLRSGPKAPNNNCGWWESPSLSWSSGDTWGETGVRRLLGGPDTWVCIGPSKKQGLPFLRLHWHGCGTFHSKTLQSLTEGTGSPSQAGALRYPACPLGLRPWTWWEGLIRTLQTDQGASRPNPLRAAGIGGVSGQGVHSPATGGGISGTT